MVQIEPIPRAPWNQIFMPNMTTSSDFHLDQITQISINAHDLERAAAFYRDTLGIKHLFTVPNMAFFDCNGIRLMVAIPTSPDLDHPSSILYFKVGDIQQAYQKLLARGVQFVNQPTLVAQTPSYDLWIAAFRDSEQNLLSLMSEVPKKAT
jgi:predicted enzyme related to lactoylglutathione lyase